MNGTLFSLVLQAALSVCGQVPYGFEIIEISESEEYHAPPHVNECGEVIYSEGAWGLGESRVVLYDNGLWTQLTSDDANGWLPDINEAGHCVWSDRTPEGVNYVTLGGVSRETQVIGIGETPRINNLGHVAYYNFDPLTCAYESIVYFYDGTVSIPISSVEYSNLSPTINDSDTIVWSEHLFCVFPWQSRIRKYSDGETVTLTNSQFEPQLPDINNAGVVAWTTDDIDDNIEIWEDGIVTLFSSWGYSPKLNELGDLYFIRWHDDIGMWQPWMYYEGEFYRLLTEDDRWGTDGDINDYGECVWTWSIHPSLESWGTRLMRRIRNGDLDRDQDVDAADFAPLPGCLTGPTPFDRLCDCRFHDLDHDRDIDLADVAIFQGLYQP